MVNRDAIRMSVHGQPYISQAEDVVTLIEDKMVRSLFIAGHDTVIVDATHMSEERINRWRSAAWELSFAVFPAGKGECIDRAIASDRRYLIDVIKRMADITDFCFGAVIEKYPNQSPIMVSNIEDIL